MAKRKYPSEVNTRTVRVNLGDWKWLNSLSQALGTTVAEAFHKVITEQAHKDKVPVVEPAQIPLPVFRVAADISPSQVAADVSPHQVAITHIKSTSVKLRVTVAGRGETNGRKQV